MHRALEQTPFVCQAHVVAACPSECGGQHRATRKPIPSSKVVRNVHPRALRSPPPATGGATGTHRLEGRQRVGARAATPSAPGSSPAGGATSGRKAGTGATFPAPPARPRCPRPAEGVERPGGAVSPAGGRGQPRGRRPDPPHPGSATTVTSGGQAAKSSRDRAPSGLRGGVAIGVLLAAARLPAGLPASLHAGRCAGGGRGNHRVTLCVARVRGRRGHPQHSLPAATGLRSASRPGANPVLGTVLPLRSRGAGA